MDGAIHLPEKRIELELRLSKHKAVAGPLPRLAGSFRIVQLRFESYFQLLCSEVLGSGDDFFLHDSVFEGTSFNDVGNLFVAVQSPPLCGSYRNLGADTPSYRRGLLGTPIL
ncbi:hypothetical protein C2E31_14605 [Rhodopirellula baltica]|nr:hypothetical protein C2E31_14605 [Rhodopirellula baltica]